MTLRPKKPNPLKVFLVTILAWVGLAGLADGLVDWQNWFEAGIMQHWRSVKVWVNAVVFWWLPFDIPNWIFDWLVLALMALRSTHSAGTIYWRGGLISKRISVPMVLLAWPLLLISLLLLWRHECNYLPSIKELEKLKREVEEINAGLKPGNGSVLIAAQLADKVREVKFQSDQFAAVSQSLKLFVLALVGFIPVLFVVSTVLYEFG